MPKNKTKNKYYIDPEEFYVEVSDWIYAKRENPNLQWTDSLCKKFMLMIEGMAHRPNFSGYSYIDEMKSQARFNIMKYGHNYKPEKLDANGKPYKPYSYFNMIIWQAFVSVLNAEEKQQVIKQEFFKKNYTLDDSLFIDGADGHTEILEQMVKMYDDN